MIRHKSTESRILLVPRINVGPPEIVRRGADIADQTIFSNPCRPSHRRTVSVLRLFIMNLSLTLASVATNAAQLIFTQRLLHGIGGAMVYNISCFYLEEWFIKRKGLAYSIFWAGTGISHFYVVYYIPQANS